MNIIDAIKSGKPFRVVGAKDWIRYDADLCIPMHYMLNDFEIQQEPGKVNLYQYLYKNQNGYKELSKETSASWKCSSDYCIQYELLKTFTREIEY